MGSGRGKSPRGGVFGSVPKHIVVASICIATFLVLGLVTLTAVSFVGLSLKGEHATLNKALRGVPKLLDRKEPTSSPDEASDKTTSSKGVSHDAADGGDAADADTESESPDDSPNGISTEEAFGRNNMNRGGNGKGKGRVDVDGKPRGIPEPQTRILIGRPYTPWDVLKMTESFIEWNSMIACEDPDVTRPWIDIALYFSQSAKDHPHVQVELDKMRVIWNESKAAGGWAACFGKLEYHDIGTPPDEDVYTAKGQFVRADWVSGPNIVFRESFRKSQTIDDYEIMFFMESDTTPLQDYWLDFLLGEVEKYRPFTVLGSSYQGDKWDNFLKVLPLSLITHINGNGLYNVTCECSKAIMDQMYKEVGTTGNAVAFDYRWMQMVQEATTGLPNEYDPYPGVPDPDTGELMVVLRENNVMERMKQIPLFKNYAATNMVPSLFDEGIMFQHGARMHQDWDKEVHGDVTLLISDWKGETPHLLKTLSSLPSYIDDTILVVPFGTELDLPYSYNSSVRVIHRGAASVNRDICSVPIKTKWFVVTDSEHRLKPEVPLMISQSGKLVTPEATVKSAQCENHEYCRVDLAIAEAFGQSDPSVYLPEDFVFHTGMRNEYCKRIMPLFHDERFPYARPSATSYAAFLQTVDAAKDYYSFVNIGHYGCRSRFPVSPLVLDESEHEQGDPFPTDCNLQITKNECLALPRCEFRTRFGCRQNFDLVVRELSVPHEKEDPYKILAPLDTPVAFRDELIQIVKEAHEYWLDPEDESFSDYVPATPEDFSGELPDKIFLCADYFELLIFFPYFEGEIYHLESAGAMYFDSSFIPESVHPILNANLKIVQEHATENSLLLGNVLLHHDCLPDAILDFPGKQLLRNSEPQDFNFLTDGELELYPDWAMVRGFPELPDPHHYLPPSDKVFVVGSHEDSPTSVRVPYLTFVVAFTSFEQHRMLFDPSMKPVNKKKHFMIYSASHFISYREEAMQRLATIGDEIHYAGKCQGTGRGRAGSCIPYTDEERPSNIIPSPYDTESHDSGVTGNHKLFQHYRFALVMENLNEAGYITEKLVNAFLSGAIPIWYGTRDAFKIFNEKALIYYDVENPEPALEKIAYLEKNPAAYDAMTKEPILAAGEETIKEWFSIRDEIGGGRLKRKVLDLMDIRDLGSTAIFDPAPE